nr:thermonuclease family protein [uncultured Gellertiella sp.]
MIEVVPHRFRRLIYRLIFFAFLALLGFATGRRHGDAPAILPGPFGVVDGDTLTFRGERLRLAGLDAPERAQRCGGGTALWACGTSATRALSRRLTPDVACTARGRDKYRRRLVVCGSGPGSGDVGAWLVRNGYALAYGNYAAEEAEARLARRGIWTGPFERPDDWRKAHHDTSGGNPPWAGWLGSLWQ